MSELTSNPVHTQLARRWLDRGRLHSKSDRADLAAMRLLALAQVIEIHTDQARLDALASEAIAEFSASMIEAINQHQEIAA